MVKTKEAADFELKMETLISRVRLEEKEGKSISHRYQVLATRVWEILYENGLGEKDDLGIHFVQLVSHKDRYRGESWKLGFEVHHNSRFMVMEQNLWSPVMDKYLRVGERLKFYYPWDEDHGESCPRGFENCLNDEKYYLRLMEFFDSRAVYDTYTGSLKD